MSLCLRTGSKIDDEIEEAIILIRTHLVNRDDRYGTYYEAKEGNQVRLIPTTAPSPERIAKAKEKGKSPPFLGPHQLYNHVCMIGKPIGVHSISKKDTCQWLGYDIDRHSDSVSVGAISAARDLIMYTLRIELGLECILEDSGGGGWHIWVPISQPVPAKEAHMVASYVLRKGQDGWIQHDPDPKIEAFPCSPTRYNAGDNLGGRWLRLPGKHQKRDHISTLILEDGRRIGGLDMWEHFSAVAQVNTLNRWKVACDRVPVEQLVDAEPSRKATPKPSAPKAVRPRSAENAKVRMPIEPYTGWAVERLQTEPLKEGERRQRELALIRAIAKNNGTRAEAENAIMDLYTKASGDSRDLSSVAMKNQLIRAIPDMVTRLFSTTRRPYQWATPEIAAAARQCMIARVEGMENAGVKGWSAIRFARWYDGFANFLRARALTGGYFFLSSTVVTTEDQGIIGYSLKDCGGGYPRKVILDDDFMDTCRTVIKQPGFLSLKPRGVQAYLAYLYLMASSYNDSHKPTPFITIVRPAKKGKQPCLIDCTSIPISYPDDNTSESIDNSSSS